MPHSWEGDFFRASNINQFSAAWVTIEHRAYFIITGLQPRGSVLATKEL